MSKMSDGSIAQLGEHLLYTQGVTGSSPVVPTIKQKRVPCRTLFSLYYLRIFYFVVLGAFLKTTLTDVPTLILDCNLTLALYSSAACLTIESPNPVPAVSLDLTYQLYKIFQIFLFDYFHLCQFHYLQLLI